MLEKTEFDVSSALPSSQLPPIPPKRYFTIGEVADLLVYVHTYCGYWEQEFTQLSPQKRRGNRRYYQHHEICLSARYVLFFTKRVSQSAVPVNILKRRVTNYACARSCRLYCKFCLNSYCYNFRLSGRSAAW